MEQDQNKFKALREGSSFNLIFPFFIAIFLISIGLLLWLLQPFFSILILAFVVTGIFKPLYNFFLKKLKPSKASLLTCIIIFLTLFAPIVIFVSILSTEAYGLYITGRDAAFDETLIKFLDNSSLAERATLFFRDYGVSFTTEDINSAMTQAGRFIGGFLFEQAQTIASNVMKFIINFFFILMIVYFFLTDGEKLINFIEKLSPLPDDQDEKVIHKFGDMCGAILLGNGFCGLLQGAAGGLVFAIFGLSSPLLWGVIMAILAFLPILGVGLVFIPASIYLFIKGRIVTAIFFVIFYVILSFSVEYVLKPRLVGKKVSMHPLLVFLAIVGGLNLFGILGVIYGPLVVTLFLTLNDIYQANYQKFVDSPKSE